MAYLEENVMRLFVALEQSLAYPNIKAILLGGSVVYQHADRGDLPSASDWDGALLVATKLDIFDLVNNNRQKLLDMFDISQEECVQLCVPAPLSPAWHDFDAVRLAGYTKSGVRKSVKILSMDYFSECKPSLNILSFKDRRIFESRSSKDGSTQYRIHQATRLGDGLLILHDQWIFRADPNFCPHGKEVVDAMFGVTADLLMTGTWIYGDIDGQCVQNQLLRHYAAVTKRHATTACFARSDRFVGKFRQGLACRLETLSQSIPLPSAPCVCGPRASNFLYGITAAVPSQLPSDLQSRLKILPSDTSSLRISPNFHLKQQRLYPTFSSNSVNGPVTVRVDSTGSESVVVFCKSSQFQDLEIHGARQAIHFYPMIQQPVLAASGELLYPYFHGRSEAERRLSFIQGGRCDWSAAEIILHAELQKAEDMLRAYRHSLQLPPVLESPGLEQPIQRFYYARLVNNIRFEQYYKAGICLKDQVLPLFTFYDLQFKVNGKKYPSMKEICRAAVATLHPSALSSCPTVFGLGDAHGSNIMIGDVKRPDNSRELLYIDYEVAGYHSPMLDLAKPFHHDVFFEMLYADNMKNFSSVKYALEDGVIAVDVSSCMDPVSQAILDIKRRYLMEPLFEFARRMSFDLEKQIPQLAAALFACSVLTRDYTGDWDVFFGNVAVGIVLSQVKDLQDLWASCDSLAR